MIEIIPATRQHFPVIRQIALEAWPVTFKEILSPEQISYMLEMMYSASALEEQLTKKGHQFLLAKKGNHIIGFASYQLNYQGQPKVKIHKIYMLPLSKGKGGGSLLIGRIAEIAREHHAESLSLNVNRYNSATGFYEKMGFIKTGEENIPIGNGYLMEDFIMKMDLLPQKR